MLFKIAFYKIAFYIIRFQKPCLICTSDRAYKGLALNMEYYFYTIFKAEEASLCGQQSKTDD